jgi:hypothetical protein
MFCNMVLCNKRDRRIAALPQGTHQARLGLA